MAKYLFQTAQLPATITNYGRQFTENDTYRQTTRPSSYNLTSHKARDELNWFETHLTVERRKSSTPKEIEEEEIETRKYLSYDVSESIVQAVIISRIDYCNSLLVGVPAVQLSKPVATGLEQTPLNRCQRLPAPYKRLMDDTNKTNKRQTD